MKKSTKNKPLPKPPATAFGRKRQFEEGTGQEPLTADRMAAAIAEGKLDEFLKQEMPDNEYAKRLATMMMGMTGMMPYSGAPQAAPTASSPGPSPESGKSEQPITARDVPEPIRKAARDGDVQGLMNMLRQEHQKRNPNAHEELPKTKAVSPSPQQDKSGIEQAHVDALIRIAKENNVTIEWMIFRAIKFYVQEYRRTGKL